MLTFISFLTLGVLAKVKSTKQTRSRTKLCPQTPKHYFLFQMDFEIKRKAKAQGQPLCSPSWQEVAEQRLCHTELRRRHLNAENVSLKTWKRHSEGWFLEIHGLIVYAALKKSKRSSYCTAAPGQGAPIWCFNVAWCLKIINMGTGTDVTNRSKKPRSNLSSITSGHACADGWADSASARDRQ